MAPHSSKQASVSIKVFLYSGFVSVDRLQEGSPDSVPMVNLVDSSVKSLADQCGFLKHDCGLLCVQEIEDLIGRIQ